MSDDELMARALIAWGGMTTDIQAMAVGHGFVTLRGDGLFDSAGQDVYIANVLSWASQRMKMLDNHVTGIKHECVKRNKVIAALKARLHLCGVGKEEIDRIVMTGGM